MVATGIIGGYTTFSTLSVEMLQLTAAGRTPLAAGYAVVTAVGGLAAVWGWVGGRAGGIPVAVGRSVTWLAVAVGGAAGAACRYVVDFVVSQRSGGVFPWSTWTVNITGSVLLGLLAGVAAGRAEPQLWQVAATGGFCGANTTFSTFRYETLQLIERRAWWESLWFLASQVVGVTAAACGWLLSTCSQDERAPQSDDGDSPPGVAGGTCNKEGRDALGTFLYHDRAVTVSTRHARTRRRPRTIGTACEPVAFLLFACD